jgi:signal transduction histidine kinase
VVILLPVALFLLVLLSIFTLFAYRSGIALLLEERHAEALSLARRVAAEAAAGPPSTQDLRRLAPTAQGIAVIGADGRTLARSGDLPEGGLLAPLEAAGEDTGAAGPRAVGPDPVVGDAVAAFVPLAGDGSAGWVRLDLGASGLARERRGLRVLTALVLGVDAALVVLVVLFLGRLVAPWDTLLERARRAGETPPEAGDEVDFLVGTFERALEALARPRTGGEGDEIAALQRALATSFESGVLLLDRRGDVVTVNPAGAQILEIEPLEIEPAEIEPPEGGAPEGGRPPGEVLAAHPALARLLADAVAGRRGVRRREIETTTPSGRRLDLGLTVHPLRREGDPIGYLVLFADLTEVRRRSEQAHLAESLRQIGELAAGVAHELRNSLATLKGYLTLIERAGGGEATGPAGDRAAVAEYVGEVRRETDHLQRVLEDFLSFARPGTARLEEVDLRQVLARAAADPVLAGARVRLAPPADPADRRPLTLSGDPQLLERAFRNLLHNAVAASRETAGAGRGAAPAVEVAAAATDDGLEVTVADRGPGVPDEVKARLFQPFASGRSGGVGLGLALARRILVLHGGRLELEDRPGGGTVARAALPVTGAAEASDAPAAPAG